MLAGLLCMTACDGKTHTVGFVGPDRGPRANIGVPADSQRRSSASAPSETEAAASLAAQGTVYGPSTAGTVAPTMVADITEPEGGAGAGSPPPMDAAPEPASSAPEPPQGPTIPVPTVLAPSSLPVPSSQDLAPAADLEDEQDEEPACPSEVAVPRRVDMYFLVDRFFSLPITNPLDLIQVGMQMFVNSADAQGISTALLSVRSQCNPLLYGQPDVDWGLLPAHARDMLDGINTLNLAVAQAEPAIEAAFEHARSRSVQHPESKQVLVLITDGFDVGVCPGSTQASTESTIQSGTSGTPDIPMYVVSLATNFVEPGIIPGDLELAALAEAGGTTERVVDIRTSGAGVANALSEVRVDAQPCEYAVPAGMDEPRLRIADEDPLPDRRRRLLCGSTWDGYYTTDIGGSSFLVACPATCTRIKAVGHEQVRVEATCD